MPQTHNIGNIINSHTRFVRETRENTSNSITNSAGSFVLKRAVVVDINRWPEIDGPDVVTRNPYAIAAVLINQDTYGQNPSQAKNKVWYPPLSPLTNVSLPEIGEEVFIIKEDSSRKKSLGYWVGRVNNSNNLQYTEARSHLPDGDKFPRGEINFKRLRETTPMKPGAGAVPYSPIPAYDGDVIQQGRTGTYLRHSFDPANNSGLMEMGINITGIKGLEWPQPTIGRTLTKTLHYEQMTLEKISGNYRLMPNNFQPYITTQDRVRLEEQNKALFKLETEPKDSIINISQNHYNFSIDQDGNSIDNYLYRQVLGDRNKEVIENLLIVIKDLKDLVYKFYNEYKDHVHIMPRQVFRYGKYIGAGGGLVNIVFRQPEKETKQIETNQDIYDMDLEIEKFDEKITEIDDRLESTLSKTQFIQ